MDPTKQSSPIQSQIHVAKQTAQILYAEVQKANSFMRDTTLERASHSIAPIPPKRYIRQFNTLKGHKSKIAQIQWAPDSVTLVSACQDGFMIIWDTVTGYKLQAIPLENSWVLLCAYSPSGRYVALAGLDNRCTIYRVGLRQNTYESPGGSIELHDRGARGRTIPRAHTAYISACEFVADHQILTASGDMTIALWDMEKESKSRDFIDHVGDVLLLLISPKERMSPQVFLSSGADGFVKVWDIRAKSPQHSHMISRSDVNCLTQLSDGYSFISGADDGLCTLFDLRSSCELDMYDLRAQFKPASKKTYTDGSGTGSPTSEYSMWSQFDAPGVVSLDVSRSGRLLYACYADYGCITWDLLKNSVVDLIGVGSGSHLSRISQVSVSPDGQGLATASWDSTIKIWSS